MGGIVDSIFGGGSQPSGTTTTVQKSDPWSGVQPYLLGSDGSPGIYSSAQNQFKNSAWNPQMQSLADQQAKNIGYRVPVQVGQMNNIGEALFGGQYDPNIHRVGNISGAQQITPQQVMAKFAPAAAQAQASSASAGQGKFDLGNLGLGAAPADAYTRMLTGKADTSTLDPVVNSAMRRLTDNFNEQVMPSINQGAQMAGQYGGSRQGIAQGLAAKGLALALGDTAGNMYNSAYNQAQGLMGQAAGQLGGFSTSIANNNAALQTQANVANANAATQAALANAAARNAMAQFNAAQANNMGQFNADNSLKAQTLNAANDLNSQQFNANLGLKNNEQSAAQAQQKLSNQLQGLNLGQSANQLTDQNYQQAMGLLNAPNEYGWNNLNNYSSIVQNGARLGGSTSSDQPYFNNAAGNLLGTGMGALGIYNMGKMGGLWGGAGAASGFFPATTAAAAGLEYGPPIAAMLL